MRVLFVYRGYGISKNNPVIDAQIESLRNIGFSVLQYPILKGGLINYFLEYIKLFFFVWGKNIDIIHAHYSYSGFISALTFKKTVCSLMGSDVLNQPKIPLLITQFFSRYLWKKTIVKSSEMSKIIPSAQILPNGINLEIFKPLDKKDAIHKTGLNEDKIYILFVATDINSKVKNFSLAKLAVKRLGMKNVVLLPLSNVTQAKLCYYYNAADLLLLTSYHEGSPNVIKEAMACNCPIVSTDVGDVKELIKFVEGCYIAKFSASDIAEKIKKVITKSCRTKGRDAISHLDHKVIAQKLVSIYKELYN